MRRRLNVECIITRTRNIDRVITIVFMSSVVVLREYMLEAIE